MSELNSKHDGRFVTKDQFLSTVSAMALLGATIGAGTAVAEDYDGNHSKVWIELGWQFEDQGPKPAQFAPPFSDAMAAIGFTRPSDIEGSLPWSYGPEGKITFQPAHSDWVISAALRYGRSNGHKLLHQQTPSHYGTLFFGTHPIATHLLFEVLNFGQTDTKTQQDHLIVDFEAGQDVEIGLFGSMGHSLLSAGLRMVEFHGKTYSKVDAVPDFVIQYHVPKYLKTHHNYEAVNQASASLEAFGPSVSWDSSAQLTGSQAGGLTFDWGASAALLFGRQKAIGSHKTVINYYKSLQSFASPTSIKTRSTPHDRRHSIAVPNLGGFAGLSLRFPHGKVSLGYRGDIFFGAMDEGVDTRKTYNMYFHGPYATVSIGLGG